MSPYQRDRARVDKALRQSGIVVVINRDHVRSPADMVTTMTEIHRAGLVAEITFRIDRAILREGMQRLVTLRDEAPADNPFILGVGSVINRIELDAAIDMGFDMVVGPAGGLGGNYDPVSFIKMTRAANVFCAPAVFTPTELQFYIERDDGLEPDAVKIFPARSHGPDGISDLLAPYVRDRHARRIIMPTGAVNVETGPLYRDAIAKRGFTPVLGMSAPLALVKERDKPGDLDTIRESLDLFSSKFPPAAE